MTMPYYWTFYLVLGLLQLLCFATVREKEALPQAWNAGDVSLTYGSDLA